MTTRHTRAARLVLPVTASREEWLAERLRLNGVGGSEIAAVVGLSPFESRFSLWHRKMGFARPQVENVQMKWGRRLERAIAEEFADQHPEFWVRNTGMWRNKERDWQFSSPDRLLRFRGTSWTPVDAFTEPPQRSLLEVKLAHDGQDWGEPGTDQIPVYYRCQLIWYMDCLGLDVAYLAVLIGGMDLREYVLAYDAEEAEYLRQEAEAFRWTLEVGERPSIDEHGATYRVVRELHPDIDDVEIELNAELADQYRAAVADFKAAEAAKQKATSEVLDAMGTARRATYGGDSIAIRVSGRAGNPPSLRPSQQKMPTAGRKVTSAA